MRLGLIAGNGAFPFLVLDAARRLGHGVTVIAVEHERRRTWRRPRLAKPQAAFHWVPLVHLGRAIELMQASGVTQA